MALCGGLTPADTVMKLFDRCDVGWNFDTVVGRGPKMVCSFGVMGFRNHSLGGRVPV